MQGLGTLERRHILDLRILVGQFDGHLNPSPACSSQMEYKGAAKADTKTYASGSPTGFAP
jgi:hypothetical protein